MANAVQAVIDQLGNYLKDEISEIQKFQNGFPAANQKLNYPTLTIVAGKPQYMPLDPYVIEKGDVIAAPSPDAGKAPVKRVVGQYDFILQLDLWCRSKPERHDIYQKVFEAFNQTVPTGLSLQLEDYHGIWCRYDLTDLDFDADEMESQKSEWRAKATVLANCFAVIEKNEYLIQEIENTLETPASIDAPEASSGEQII